MELYALIEAGDAETIDVFLSRPEAERALADCLTDEPDWHGTLRIEMFELHASVTAN